MVEKYDVSIDDGKLKTSRRRDITQKKHGSTWYYVGLAGQIGYAIAIPLAGGALVGSYFDSKSLTASRYTLLGLGIGFFISIVGFYSVIKEITRK